MTSTDSALPADVTDARLDPGSARHLRRVRTAQAELQYLPERPVRDPRGGAATLARLTEDLHRVRARIETEPREPRHDRISSGRRLLVHLLPLLDGVVLFWFLLGVLNVDLRRPDTGLVVAAGLALLTTVALAQWAATVGQHLQRFADRRGDLIWNALDATARGMLAASAVVWLLVGAMMFIRVRDEVFQSTGLVDISGAVIALVLAAAAVVLHAYVLYLSFSDGSRETRELDALARATMPLLRRRARLVMRVADGTERLQARTTARASRPHSR